MRSITKRESKSPQSIAAHLDAALADLEIKGNRVRVVLSRASAKESMTQDDLRSVQGKIKVVEDKLVSSGDSAGLAVYLAEYRGVEQRLIARLEQECKHTRVIQRRHDQMGIIMRQIRNQKDQLEARFYTEEATREVFELAGGADDGLLAALSEQVSELEIQNDAAREDLPDMLQWDLDLNETK